MKPEILDNFLDQNDFLNLQESLFETHFPWYFQQGVSYQHDLNTDYLHNYQFTHLFFNAVNANDSFSRSHFFPILEPLIKKINPTALLRVKANLIPVTAERIIHQMHVDLDIKCKTAIFYVNTNNGATIFQSGEEVASIGNRLMIFDSTQKHTSSSCTDKKVRCVININYF